MDQIACPESLPSLHVWSSSQIQDSHHWCSHTFRTCPIIPAILYSLVTILDQCSQLVPMDMPVSLPNWFIPNSSALLNPELLWNSQWSMNKFSVFQTSSLRGPITSWIYMKAFYSPVKQLPSQVLSLVDMSSFTPQITQHLRVRELCSFAHVVFSYYESSRDSRNIKH